MVGFDVCGFYNDIPAGITEITKIIEETKMIQDIFKFSGIVKQHGTNKLHNIFADFENRLKSYEKCEVELKIDSQKLCEAGFIYMGRSIIYIYNIICILMLFYFYFR